ncbi:MAG: glycosyltransferase family 2 protein [Spirochaetia bacterium]|nr:glycosyltransferase family 2 protein [Spirochaetia bacterium]
MNAFLNTHYDISIVLPTYNEKENIVIVLDKIQRVLKNIRYQIIVVDDNSPDNTWEIASGYAKKYPNIQVIRRMNNRGLSTAIMEGFASSSSKWVVVMDADLQHDEKILTHFYNEFSNGYDIIIGSRKIAGGSISEWSFLRRIISWIATKMAFIVIKNNVSDPMSGFFGITKEMFESSIHKINPRGFKLLLELLAHNPSAKVFEIGYTFNKRIHGKSKLDSNIIFDYLAALYDLSFGKYLPLRLFKYLVTGLTGLIVNQFGIWLGLNIFHLSNNYAIALAIECSIVNNYFINNFWTFRDYRHRGIQIIPGLISFQFVSLAGAVINYSSTLFFISQLAINIYLANIGGIILSTLWNYRMNFQVTWKKEL